MHKKIKDTKTSYRILDQPYSDRNEEKDLSELG